MRLWAFLGLYLLFAGPEQLVNCQDEAQKDEKVFKRFQDIVWPKGNWSFWKYSGLYGQTRVGVVVPEDQTIKPYLFYLDQNAITERDWLEVFNYAFSIPAHQIYSYYDFITGWVPRGKVIAMYGEKWPKEINIRVVDMKLESGKERRVAVRPDLFANLSVDLRMPPEELVTPTEVSKKTFGKGWLVPVASARDTLYKYLPQDGGKTELCVTSEETFRLRYIPSDPEPYIQTDFGPCPKGAVVEKLHYSDNIERAYYFIAIEDNKTVQRYRVEGEFYQLVKVGDQLPLRK